MSLASLVEAYLKKGDGGPSLHHKAFPAFYFSVTPMEREDKVTYWPHFSFDSSPALSRRQRYQQMAGFVQDLSKTFFNPTSSSLELATKDGIELSLYQRELSRWSKREGLHLYWLHLSWRGATKNSRAERLLTSFAQRVYGITIPDLFEVRRSPLMEGQTLEGGLLIDGECSSREGSRLERQAYAALHKVQKYLTKEEREQLRMYDWVLVKRRAPRSRYRATIIRRGPSVSASRLVEFLKAVPSSAKKVKVGLEEGNSDLQAVSQDGSHQAPSYNFNSSLSWSKSRALLAVENLERFLSRELPTKREELYFLLQEGIKAQKSEHPPLRKKTPSGYAADKVSVHSSLPL